MKNWHLIAFAVIAALWLIAGYKWGAADRPTCPKSGGVCDCRYCCCPDGCPGICESVLQPGIVLTVYADPLYAECGEFGVFAMAHTDEPEGERKLVAASSQKTLGEVFADLAQQLGPRAESDDFGKDVIHVPHHTDGHWEIEKRWPKPYPFVRWVWTWDGRKDSEATIRIEAFERPVPEHPSVLLHDAPDEFLPGTKNNL